MKKKVYISGKISGLGDLNRAKFDEAEARIRSYGFDPVNPHKILPANPSLTWVDYMRADIKALMDCHMVAVLNDWRFSKGAIIEVKLALSLDMPIICAHSMISLEMDETRAKPISDKYKIRELNRELALRKRLYPGWVRSNQMTEEQAKTQIEILEAIVQDYKDLKHFGHSTQPTLFQS